MLKNRTFIVYVLNTPEHEVRHYSIASVGLTVVVTSRVINIGSMAYWITPDILEEVVLLCR